MSEIYHRGPITCGQVCPEDFTWHYNGGIYKDTSGDTELDHGAAEGGGCKDVVGWRPGGRRGVVVRNSTCHSLTLWPS